MSLPSLPSVSPSLSLSLAPSFSLSFTLYSLTTVLTISLDSSLSSLSPFPPSSVFPFSLATNSYAENSSERQEINGRARFHRRIRVLFFLFSIFFFFSFSRHLSFDVDDYRDYHTIATTILYIPAPPPSLLPPSSSFGFVFRSFPIDNDDPSIVLLADGVIPLRNGGVGSLIRSGTP